MTTPPDRLSPQSRRALDAMGDVSGANKGSDFNVWARSWKAARELPRKLLPKKEPAVELNLWEIQADVDKRQNAAFEVTRKLYDVRRASEAAAAQPAAGAGSGVVEPTSRQVIHTVDTASPQVTPENTIAAREAVWPADVPIVRPNRILPVTTEGMGEILESNDFWSQFKGDFRTLAGFAVNLLIDGRVDLDSDAGKKIVKKVGTLPQPTQDAFWWNLSARLARYIQNPPMATEVPKNGTTENPEGLLVRDEAWLQKQARFISDNQTRDGKVFTGGLHDAEGRPVTLPAETISPPIPPTEARVESELTQRAVADVRDNAAYEEIVEGRNGAPGIPITADTTLESLLDQLQKERGWGSDEATKEWTQRALNEYRRRNIQPSTTSPAEDKVGGDVAADADHTGSGLPEGSSTSSRTAEMPPAESGAAAVSGVPVHEEAATQKPSFDELLDQIESGKSDVQAGEIADAIIREGQSRVGFEDLRALNPGLVELVQKELRDRLVSARAAGTPLKNESDFRSNFELGIPEAIVAVPTASPQSTNPATEPEAVPESSAITPSVASVAPVVSETVAAEKDRARRMQDSVALIVRNIDRATNPTEKESGIILAANALLTVPGRRIAAEDFDQILNALPAGETSGLVKDAVFKLVRLEAGRANPPDWITPWTDLQAYKDWDTANPQGIVLPNAAVAPEPASPAPGVAEPAAESVDALKRQASLDFVGNLIGGVETAHTLQTADAIQLIDNIEGLIINGGLNRGDAEALRGRVNRVLDANPQALEELQYTYIDQMQEAYNAGDRSSVERLLQISGFLTLDSMDYIQNELNPAMRAEYNIAETN